MYSSYRTTVDTCRTLWLDGLVACMTAQSLTTVMCARWWKQLRQEMDICWEMVDILADGICSHHCWIPRPTRKRHTTLHTLQHATALNGQMEFLSADSLHWSMAWDSAWNTLCPSSLQQWSSTTSRWWWGDDEPPEDEQLSSFIQRKRHQGVQVDYDEVEVGPPDTAGNPGVTGVRQAIINSHFQWHYCVKKYELINRIPNIRYTVCKVNCYL